MTGLRSNAEWKQWGKDDPLFAVAAWAGKQKEGASPWTDEDFYALGESDWREFVSHWRQYGINPQRCLEIGCGAGRLTRQLAMSFDHVCAVDVSEDMIGRARKAVESRNVEFSIIDGLHLPQGECSVTAIFSTHVFQHLDSVAIGFSYFREFFRVLDVGGTIMIHLPLYQFPNGSGKFGVLMSSLYAVYRALANVRAYTQRRLGVKLMRETPYPIQSLSLFLSDLGFKNVEFRVFSVRSNGNPHPFVLATK